LPTGTASALAFTSHSHYVRYTTRCGSFVEFFYPLPSIFFSYILQSPGGGFDPGGDLPIPSILLLLIVVMVGDCDRRTEIVGRSSSLPWTGTPPRNDRIIPRPIRPAPFFASILVYFLIATTILLVGKRKGKDVIAAATTITITATTTITTTYYYHYSYYH